MIKKRLLTSIVFVGMIVASSLIQASSLAAITADDLNASVRDTVWYDPNSCSYEDDTDNPCVCSAGSAGTDASNNIPEPWRTAFMQAASKYGANANFLAALYLSENGNVWHSFDRNWPTSHAGASGPMQFMPGTWSSYGVDGDGDGIKDINNVHDAVHAAANLVTTGLKTDGSTPLGTVEQPLAQNTLLRAAAGYNWGPGNVNNAGESAPLSRLPTETQNYVKNIHELFTSNFTKSGHPSYQNPKPAGSGEAGSSVGLSLCAGGSAATVDGFTFPLVTTKTVIKEGIKGLVWCYQSQSNCHHNYEAADIMVPTGTPVVVAIPGRVMTVREGGSVGSRITIMGDDGRLYYYTHMGMGTLQVDEGQDVVNAQPIGLVGTAEEGVWIEHLHIDALPGSTYSSRPSCTGSGCSSLPFFNLQPSLVKSYEALPE